MNLDFSLSDYAYCLPLKSADSRLHFIQCSKYMPYPRPESNLYEVYQTKLKHVDNARSEYHGAHHQSKGRAVQPTTGTAGLRALHQIRVLALHRLRDQVDGAAEVPQEPRADATVGRGAP